VIEHVLGSGGFGITYIARDVSLSRKVAIKENLPSQFAHRNTTSLVIGPGSGREDQENFEWSMSNFLREAETLASLDHPGIVRVLRKFEANGTVYFVMPFVDGLAFDTLIEDRRRENRRFSDDELRGLLERLLGALAYLHDRGIYHRDIKPGNILISNDGVPALIDFGSAHQRLSERSMTVIESAGYTPFEQLQSRGNVGPWSDLYALGTTLVKAITFETMPKAADRIMGDPWPGLLANDKIAGHYSPQLLSSIERALAPLPDQRWQDAKQWQQVFHSDPAPTRDPARPEVASASPKAFGDSVGEPRFGGDEPLAAHAKPARKAKDARRTLICREFCDSRVTSPSAARVRLPASTTRINVRSRSSESPEMSKRRSNSFMISQSYYLRKTHLQDRRFPAMFHPYEPTPLRHHRRHPRSFRQTQRPDEAPRLHGR
jgi:serine/threonine protein kinase